MTRHAIRVECPLPLPPARTIAEAVWGMRGRVEEPDVAGWERLVIVSATHANEWIEIVTIRNDPRVLEVASTDPKLARTAALHLAMETHGKFL